jgi:hypothetical protein
MMDVVKLLQMKMGGVKVSGKEHIFHVCPFCKNERWNVQVCFSLGVWHTWCCDRGGRLDRLLKLFGFVGDYNVESSKEIVKEEIDLKEWLPVVLVKDLKNLSWFRYFIDKEIDVKDLEEWGARVKGDRILFPVFGVNGELGYWVVRDMKTGQWLHPRGWSREVAYFKVGKVENKVVLVEGVPDGIKVNKCGFSVLVLLGLHLKPVDERFLERSRLEVILCFDSDVPYYKYKKVVEKLKTVRWVDVSPYDDPSDMKLRELKSRIEEAKIFGLSDELRLRMRNV